MILQVYKTFLSHWDLSKGIFGSLSLGKAGCDTSAIQAFCLFFVLQEPIKLWHGLQDFSRACVIFLLAHTHGATSVYSLIKRTFVRTESAQNLDSGETRPQMAHKVSHKTVTHPCGDHLRSCWITAFERKSSCCALPTPPYIDEHAQALARKNWKLPSTGPDRGSKPRIAAFTQVG